MPFFTITLIHNQALNLPEILLAYKSQSLVPDCFVFVLDRCTDKSQEHIQRFAVSNTCIVIENTYGDSFMAGYCRDLGLSSLELSPTDVVLFLDGDCIPSRNLFRSMYSSSCSDVESLAIGARENQICQGSSNFNIDGREGTPWLKGKVFQRGIDNTVNAMCLAKIRMLIWSCCFAANAAAISKIKNINTTLGGRARMFSESFDGKWGGEDDYVGLIAMLWGVPVVAVNPEDCVQHIWHPPRTDNSFMHKAKEKYKQLHTYAIECNAPGLANAATDPQIFERDFFSKLRSGMPDACFGK
jgi:hypothetical protein